MGRAQERGAVAGWPTLAAEAWAWSQGFRRIAGIDEAGRGCLAGPVVAAAVILPADPAVLERLGGVRDSKLLSARQRCEALGDIEAAALGVSVGVASSWEIDAHGIVAATRRAMARAARALSPTPDFLLIDYLRLPEVACPQQAIVKGDRVCLSIAAASIVAKVVRDEWMGMLEEAWPGYGFDLHKGYPTAAHQEALASKGPCPIHRRTFAPVGNLAAGDEMDAEAG